MDFNLKAKGNSLVQNNIFQNRIPGNKSTKCAKKADGEKLASMIFILVLQVFVLRLEPSLKVVHNRKAQSNGRLCSLTSHPLFMKSVLLSLVQPRFSLDPWSCRAHHGEIVKDPCLTDGPEKESHLSVALLQA